MNYPINNEASNKKQPKREKRMSRIDVIKSGEGKKVEFRVLHNMIQEGISRHDSESANQDATKLSERIKVDTLNLFQG